MVGEYDNHFMNFHHRFRRQIRRGSHEIEVFGSRFLRLLFKPEFLHLVFYLDYLIPS